MNAGRRSSGFCWCGRKTWLSLNASQSYLATTLTVCCYSCTRTRFPSKASFSTILHWSLMCSVPVRHRLLLTHPITVESSLAAIQSKLNLVQRACTGCEVYSTWTVPIIRPLIYAIGSDCLDVPRPPESTFTPRQTTGMKPLNLESSLNASCP